MKHGQIIGVSPCLYPIYICVKYVLRLKEKYIKEVVPGMMKKFGYRNAMAVPKIEKVVVNFGIGKILESIDPAKRKSMTESLLSDFSLICGQKPVLTKAKKSIAGFKIRKGSIVGIKVSLRKNRMYDFLERLINLSLPRLRDFQGISLRAIDKGNNLTIGIKEHIVFPEIQPEKAKVVFGLEITVASNAKKREEAIELFKLTGFPIRFKS